MLEIAGGILLAWFLFVTVEFWLPAVLWLLKGAVILVFFAIIFSLIMLVGGGS